MPFDVAPPRFRPSEKLLKQGPANLQRGIETVGGWLFLTNQRLIFRSHKFNVQKGVVEIDLKHIRGTNPCWTKVLNLVPLVPNSLAVLLDSGLEHRFVLSKRGDWKHEIDRAVGLRRVVETTVDEATIGDAWKRLEHAVADALGSAGWGFGDPASEEEIAYTEKELGIAFPDEFRASLRIHNGDTFSGTGTDIVASVGPFRHIDFLPLSALVDEWRSWKEELGHNGLDPNTDKQIRPEWWNENWIPISVIGGASNHHCIDLAPAKLGHTGQVIEILHDDDRRSFVARSFKAFLLKLACDVETGVYVKMDGSLVHKEWL